MKEERKTNFALTVFPNFVSNELCKRLTLTLAIFGMQRATERNGKGWK